MLVLSFCIINVLSVHILLGAVYQNDGRRNWIKLSSAVYVAVGVHIHRLLAADVILMLHREPVSDEIY